MDEWTTEFEIIVGDIATKHALSDCSESEQPTGRAFFSSVGVIEVGVARSAGVAVKDGLHSGPASLANDIRSKVDLVMGRANARRDLHY
jgi:hypothetical protein